MFSRCRDWVMKKRKKGKFCRWSRCAPSEQASNEFIGMEGVQMPPEERRQSLPRRLLGRFLSERSINDEAEELKQLMIEHGLYNRHQTLEQRRRLKELLDLEDRSLLADNERRRDDFLLLQSRQSHRNFLKNAAPPCSSTLSSEAALLYWEYLIKDNAARMQYLGSLPVLPLTRPHVPRNNRSKSEPAILQKPSVAPSQPCYPTIQPLSSLPYLETAV